MVLSVRDIVEYTRERGGVVLVLLVVVLLVLLFVYRAEITKGMGDTLVVPREKPQPTTTAVVVADDDDDPVSKAETNNEGGEDTKRWPWYYWVAAVLGGLFVVYVFWKMFTRRAARGGYLDKGVYSLPGMERFDPFDYVAYKQAFDDMAEALDRGEREVDLGEEEEPEATRKTYSGPDESDATIPADIRKAWEKADGAIYTNNRTRKIYQLYAERRLIRDLLVNNRSLLVLGDQMMMPWTRRGMTNDVAVIDNRMHNISEKYAFPTMSRQVALEELKDLYREKYGSLPTFVGQQDPEYD